MKRDDVFIRAEEFFRTTIDSDLKRSVDWSCWETAALALIALHLQQTRKEVSFKNIFNRCRYRELVKLAAIFAQYEAFDDVKTILHVCEDRTAHKLFFSVVKQCFENKNGFVPYFGEITEDEPTEEEQKLEQAKICGFALGHNFSRKKYWEGFLVGLSSAALAVVLSAFFLTIN